MLKVILLLLCASAWSRPSCDKRTALLQMKRPTYEFSVRILDRVSQETNGHFVFSPLSTWLQLLALADGARGKTFIEIMKVTRYHRMQCLREIVRELFNSIEQDLSAITKHRSIIVIDRLYEVKESYKQTIEKLNVAKVLSLNFKNNIESATMVNDIIEMDTNGVINDIVNAEDFNMSVLLMTDIAYLKANWSSPFDVANTQIETFYAYEKIELGPVKMMNQVGFFNVANIAFIDAKALELPFNDRISMILLLPTNGTASDMFLKLTKINLMTIFGLFKSNGKMLVNVKLPRFKIKTDIDNIPELLYDMGIQRVFNPYLANLEKMSDYKIFVSLMASGNEIEVTEKGVSASSEPQFLINPKRAYDFFLNRPFAYLIVDKITKGILFAGVYSEPSIY